MAARALSGAIAANIGGLRVAPLAETIAAEAMRLRADGASVVIVTSHAGGRCAAFTSPTDLSSCEPAEEIMQVAAALPLSWLTPSWRATRTQSMAHEVAGIAIIEAYMGGRAFGRIDIVVDRTHRGGSSSTASSRRAICVRASIPAPCAATPRREQRLLSGRIRRRARRPGSGRRQKPPAVRAANRRSGCRSASCCRGRSAVRAAAIPRSATSSPTPTAGAPGADVAINNTSGGLRADLPASPHLRRCSR